jgi:type II secretory pathway pseudopilin PulG
MLVSSQIRRGRNGERGYVLLTLLLLVAVLAIAFAFSVLADRKYASQQAKRDREEEMIHRGVQYTRAIRAYYRKFNRYPSKIEDLENTNQMRFLRKRYKDPITGKDFRLLHYGEAKLMGSGMMNSSIPGAMTVGANGQLTPQNGLQTSSFGGNGGFGNSFGQNSNSAFGQNNQNGQTAGNASQPDTGTGQDGQDASNGSNSTGTGTGNGSSFGSGNQFGGAPIVGVTSLSKETTIREFDKKRKYNEWQFIYDPTMDRGGLITTPYQPQLMTQGIGQTPQSMNGQNGTSPNGNGFGNSFGNGNGNNGFSNSFGNSPGGMQNNPPTSQPSNPPQQQ